MSMQPFNCDLWLIDRAVLRQYGALALAGIPMEASENVRAASESRRQKNVAILPVHGALEARSSMIGEMLGMSSMERIGYTFDALVNDESVSSIVLDVASPGGMAYGAPELANKIYEARGRKPIIAVANPMAASGGYWIAAAADRVIMTPSADVGSVGVINYRMDITAQMAAAGVKEDVIRSANAPYKAEMNETESLSDEARQSLQNRANAIEDNFTADLAKFRGVSVEHVREHFGRGRLVGAKQAIAAGMADRTGGLADTVYKLAAGRIRIASAAAQDDFDAPTSDELRRNRLRSRAESISELVKAN